MKSMKKLVTLLLSLVMLCALAMPAMADETTTYSITINGAVAGHTYAAYQVFSGVYYKGSRQNDTPAENEYLSDVQWGNGVKSTELLAALKATDKDSNYNAIFGDAFKDAETAEDVAYVVANFGDQSAKLDEFARIVGKHLYETVAGTTGPVVAGTEAKINGLSDGYYFVKDSDSDAIGAGEIATKFLVEVVGDANVTVKATAPEFKKEIVKDNATDNNKGTSVNVGDKVTFRLTAKVPDMASFDNYTFTMHDTLSEGLTFDSTSVKVKVGNDTVSDDKYDLEYPIEDEDSTDTFTISFTKDQLKNLVKHTGGTDEETKFGATIVVEYTATLNEKALTKDVETNKAHLEYTNDPSGDGTGTKKTPDAPVYVYDFDITVDKFDGTNQTGQNPDTSKKLKNAKFVLYRKVTTDGTEKVEYYYWNETDTNNKKVDWVDNVDKASVVITDDNGAATFNGLAAGTYYLKETKAPDGYNTQKEDAKVEIKAVYNTDGTLKADADGCKLKQDAEGKHYYQVESIANKAGAVLPSTGGIGTTIFYVLGSILALGAAVLLIAKKRMNGQDR